MADIIKLCRELRQQETRAEKLLWQELRNRKLINKKFLRQHPLCVQTNFGKSLYYIPDFYCHEARLVIEADGGIHLIKKQYDENRDKVLAGMGLKILRFENHEIENNINDVLLKIIQHLR
ncbi:endonuclease domain-containing protein [Mucilaginibacter rubeus]|uniref:Endonuclease domain-containing protein n=1 Tax=Mucilaginibacter rubeus TaxID=2027860 RepID=A0A5C1HYE8_9SPHI|nr:endonuclease domain-containing protein [Mucilaginibacter rubeus]QEM10846.1 endonuclease domain-containing protein [Mucilaginibacter rubeus]